MRSPRAHVRVRGHRRDPIELAGGHDEDVRGALDVDHGRRDHDSHAAIIARELGIPAIVGATTALERIQDGEIIEVDPLAGVVRVG